jgi:hypothetical protein
MEEAEMEVESAECVDNHDENDEQNKPDDPPQWARKIDVHVSHISLPLIRGYPKTEGL